MGFKNLRAFMETLEQDGLLIRVTEPVSTVLEMTEIQTRLISEGGPAVLFENPIGPNGQAFEMPVLVNLFGTVERVAWAIEREPTGLRELGETLAYLRQPEPPGGWKEVVSMLPLVKTAMAMKPKTVADAPCQDVVFEGDDINLTKFPIQTCWPNEPAPLITWPLVVTDNPHEPGEDKFNVGIYRMQVTGRDTTLMRWLKHRGGAQHYKLQKNNLPNNTFNLS